jgi:DNA-binding transcriptional LysR family regulator
LAQFGAPQTLDELTSHRCCVFRHPGTGQVLPWYLQVAGEVTHRNLPPSLSTNDTELELQAVLSGHVIAQLSGMSAAPLVREGHLVPLLSQHMTDHMSVYVYYGSRTAQPSRVRAFLDLAVKRLHGGAAFVLTKKELAATESAGRKLASQRL